MTGYVRNDVTDQIANGNTVDATPLDGEFNAIQAAFAAVGGHAHTGAVGEGAPITVIGPAQDLVASANSLTPKTDNTVDLGSSALEFKDLWIDGTANIDSLVADTADINGGTIDGAVVGGTTPAAATFTSIASTSATVGGAAVTTESNTQTLTNKTINGGSISGITDLAVADGGTGVSTITGIIRGNGTSPFSAAVAGTDFLAPAAIGTTVQAFDADLSAVAGLSTNGLIARTGAGTATTRTLTASGGISITNGDGVAGNPTIAASGITTAEIAASAVRLSSEGFASPLDTELATALWAQGLLQSQNINLATAVASTSGTAIDFTGIPSWANRVTINFAGVSTNGTSSIIVRIGDAGGIETTGYSDTLGVIEVTAVKTFFSGGSGFTVGDMGVTSDAVSGTVTLSRLTGNAWTLAGVLRSQSQRTAFSAGDKTLSDALDRVRITTFNGTDAFDAGTINISWE